METQGEVRLSGMPGSASAALERWPAGEPLAAVFGADGGGPTPVTFLARPVEVMRFSTLGAFFERVRAGCVVGGGVGAGVFGPGWVVSISYGAGHELEPSASAGGVCIQPGAAVIAARVESGMVLHHARGTAREFGGGAGVRFEERGGAGGGFRLGALAGLERRDAYIDAARRVVELIHAGDAFQVNVAHRLSAPMSGSARALAARLCAELMPRHGCYIESASESAGDVAAVVSMSPELFVEVGAGGVVRTRPMKGTRAGAGGAAALAESAKDRAELAMIVDLMRNDLGRVCAVGSVRVTEARVIEAHGGAGGRPALWQGVATVEGRLRAGLDVCDLIGASFPPGSVTGAPKVRAMRIIDELEGGLGFAGAHARRGAYCGACGFVGDDGTAMLNVAIRTAVVTGKSRGLGIVEEGEVGYGVGAGIVADSDPELEWNETVEKARGFLGLFGEGS